MTTLEDLKTIQGQLAAELLAQEQAEAAAKAAQAAYDETIEAQVAALRAKLEADHADIANAKQAAQEKLSEATAAVSKTRTEAKDKLLDFTRDTDRDEKKPISGFARRDSISCYYPDFNGGLVAELARSAPYLLQVNRKALNNFIRAHATETHASIGGRITPRLPEPFRTILPVLNQGLEFEYTWTISDKTIRKLADQTPTEEEFHVKAS